jgi:hypothetical protein
MLPRLSIAVLRGGSWRKNGNSFAVLRFLRNFVASYDLLFLA